MFFSHTILARKNPLGTVWIAAHFEKKLKKPQIDKIDVATYAEFIMFPEAPMALRFAGQLLYGLVRIYELKVHYAFKDCQRLETDINSTIKSLKINLTPGADRFQLDAITLPNTFQLDAIDLHDSEFNFDEMNRHQKTFDQITITDFSPGQENYVSVQIEESDRSSFSNQLEFSNEGFGPMDEDILPPFEGEMGERISPSKIPAQNPSNQIEIEIEIENSNLNSNQPELNIENTPPQTETEISNSNLNQPEPNIENAPVQNPIETDFSNSNPNFFGDNSEPEILRAAEISAENNNNTNDNNNANVSKSPPNRREIISPIEPNRLEFSSANIIINNSNSPINDMNSPSPRLIDAPSSSHHLNEVELQARAASPVRRNKRKRNKTKREPKDIYDEVLVLSNKEMKEQQKDASDLACKRGKLPHKSIHIYRLENHLLKDQVFSKPIFHGMFKSSAELMNDLPKINNSHVGPAEEMTWQAENATPGSIENPRFNTTPQDGNNETLNENSQSQSPNINIGKNGGAQTEILPNEFNASSPVGVTWQPENVTPGGEMEINEPLFAIPESPVNDDNYSINNDNISNNNSGSNRGLNFLETPESVKAKRARIEEEADERGENLSFVDIEREEENCWSARSMEMARFLRKITPNTEVNSQHINLNEILENRTRKESARMFFETLVLTTCDYISVKQEKPYGDIVITPKPKLSDATQN